jgi:hypothetical protein
MAAYYYRCIGANVVVAHGGRIMNVSGMLMYGEASARAALANGIALQIAEALDRETSTEDLLAEIQKFDPDPGKALQAAALADTAISAELARAFMVLYLRTWQSYGRENFLIMYRLPTLTGDERLRHRLSVAFECALAIADADDTDSWAEVPALLKELATDQDAEGHPLGAAYLRLFAAQTTAEPTEAIELAERCAIAASKGRDLKLLQTASCVRASSFQTAWAAGTATDVDVFDAMDAAIRHLATSHPPDTQLLTGLSLAARKTPIFELLFPAMWPLVRAIECAAGRTPAPTAEDEAPIELDRVAWDVELYPLGTEVIPRIAPSAYRLERDRDGLEHGPADAVAHAEWSTWSFQHTGYRRAVPHSISLERERDSDDILLIIHHEATHVISMVGGIGTAIMALRAAVEELELDLWATDQLIDATAFKLKGVAPLGRPKPETVLPAMCQLDALEKMQTLQDIWNPWFEGLAIFAELCDNPTADDTTTVAASILPQLIDLQEDAGQTAKEREQTFRDIRSRFEQKVAKAQRELGPVKLQYYCESMSAKYMGGFLAVRSVVAAWRRSAGGLSGHAAIRALLHATRFATHARALPDLSLDPDEFAVAAQDVMIAWVRRMAELPADEIRFAVGTSTPSFSWLDQRIDRSEPREVTELVAEMTGLYQDQVRRALSPATFHQGTKLYLADSLLQSWTSLMSALPLGRATARFWINRTTNHLVYAVRTMEHRQDNDQPSYDLTAIPLTTEEIDALESAVAAHPFDRLTVARFADLANNPGTVGHNAIAFRLGDWTYVQARGWAFESDAPVRPEFEEAIKLRLNPNAALQMESCLIAETSGAASRTAEWAATDWFVGDEPALQGYLQRIMQRLLIQATEIRDHDGFARERAASEALVTAITGDSEQAAGLVRRGLAELTPYEPDLRASAYKALLVSGDAPAEAELRLPNGHPLHSILVHGENGWDVIPLASGPGSDVS